MELISNVLAQLGIDKTVYLQLLLMALVYLLLSRLLFRRLLTILLIRKHQISGMKDMAEANLFDYDRISREYSEKWKKYEQEGEELKKSIQEDSTRKAKELVIAANRETDKFLKNKRTEALKQIIQIESELEPEIEEMSNMVKEKLLSSKVVQR